MKEPKLIWHPGRDCTVDKFIVSRLVDNTEPCNAMHLYHSLNDDTYFWCAVQNGSFYVHPSILTEANMLWTYNAKVILVIFYEVLIRCLFHKILLNRDVVTRWPDYFDINESFDSLKVIFHAFRIPGKVPHVNESSCKSGLEEIVSCVLVHINNERPLRLSTSVDELLLCFVIMLLASYEVEYRCKWEAYLTFTY